MLSKETIKKGLYRALKGFVVSGISAIFLTMPSNFENFTDIKTWLGIAFFAFISGGLLGLEKVWSGFRKYDVKGNK